MVKSSEYKDLESKYYMQVVNRMPPVLVRGSGSYVYDNENKSYLDFTAGWAVLNLGHSHPETTKARVRLTSGTIAFETHQGTFVLSTALIIN